jgi:hypothetical protein
VLVTVQLEGELAGLLRLDVLSISLMEISLVIVLIIFFKKKKSA